DDQVNLRSHGTKIRCTHYLGRGSHMGVLSFAKELTISTGLYRPARALRRLLHTPARQHFRSYRALLEQFVRNGDLAFDVGANVGNRTQILLSLGASVVAFEPQPMCAREIFALRDKHLRVVRKAVGEREGTAQLHLKSDN